MQVLIICGQTVKLKPISSIFTQMSMHTTEFMVNILLFFKAKKTKGRSERGRGRDRANKFLFLVTKAL